MEITLDGAAVAVSGLNGNAMRGTDGANTVVPMDDATSQVEHDETQGILNNEVTPALTNIAGDVNGIAAIQEGDEIFDFANGTVTVYPRGTTSGGLLKKNLYDKDDVLVADTEAIIARTEDVTP
jgi:hypothetical protein